MRLQAQSGTLAAELVSPDTSSPKDAGSDSCRVCELARSADTLHEPTPSLMPPVSVRDHPAARQRTICGLPDAPRSARHNSSITADKIADAVVVLVMGTRPRGRTQRVRPLLQHGEHVGDGGLPGPGQPLIEEVAT